MTNRGPEQDWIELWTQEETHALAGWDFSRLQGRYLEGTVPWNYRGKVLDFLKPDTRLLDMGTGGGEFLLSLRHPYDLTSVTEGWRPNLELCERRLAPLGITVKEYRGEAEETLPFPNDSFDLIINRHAAYDISEIRRVLKSGGFFLTQQVGGENGRRLAKRLLPGFERPGIDFNLENESPKFQAAGFRIMYRNQAYPVDRFMDVGALCWYAKKIPWEFPGFSVKGCLPQLLSIRQNLEKQGFITNQQHLFMLIAKSRK